MRMIATIFTASTLVLAGCNSADKAPGATASENSVATTSSLNETLAGMSDVSTFAGAVKAAGLDGVLDDKGGYTLLAPTNAAFTALGDKASLLSDPEQRAATVAILRGHIVPGSLSSADITKAIEAAGGKPVTMRTVGDGTVSFSRDTTGLTVTASDGSKARIAGDSSSAANGAVLPIDAVLKKI